MPSRTGQTERIPNIDVDGTDYDHIDDEDELLRAGSVTADDRIEVQPWLEEEQRWSFVTSDPRATDLACFAHLRRGRISN